VSARPKPARLAKDPPPIRHTPLGSDEPPPLSPRPAKVTFAPLVEPTWCSLCQRRQVTIGAIARYPGRGAAHHAICMACVACLADACHTSNEIAEECRVEDKRTGVKR
jgi:hypothetical protein